MTAKRGTLDTREPHPSATAALQFVLSQGLSELMKWQDAFSSCAIEGNRLGEICSETLRRVMDKEPVSDRYILGLAWAIREMDRDDA